MKQKPRGPITEEHREKLRAAYNKRRQAKEMGIHLPTQKEIREAARAKKEPFTAQRVNKLVEETPVAEQECRNATITRFETSSDKRNPLRFRSSYENTDK